MALAACDDVLGRLEVEAGALRGVGISFGGPVDPHRQEVIRSMHVRAWDGAALPLELARRFALPAAIENDANAAALAEATFGAGRHRSSVFYLQVSTGIGSGLVIDGHLHRGRGGAGEVGHVVAAIDDGPLCNCGNRGCLESIASGWALARDAQRVQAGADAKALIDAARRGNDTAYTVVTAAFSALGVALANAVNLLDPDVVVVGGGIAHASDVLLPILQARLAEHVVPHLRDPSRLVISRLGPHAPLIGAAVAADRHRVDGGRQRSG